MTTPEPYMQPKELPYALQERFGLTVSYREMLDLRQLSITSNDGLFICGAARASEVFAWLKGNQDFGVRNAQPSIIEHEK